MNKKLLLKKNYLFFLLFGFLNFFGQTTINITTTGAGTWTVPCDVTSITVKAWGGGGAGGGESLNNAKGGGGGAGGACAVSTLAVTPGSTINYNVGAGGIGTTGVGQTGGDTWFVNNSTLLAKGGAGGAAPNGGTVAGGLGTTAGSIGASLFAGVSGVNGTSSASGKGGNGGNTGGTGGAGAASSGGDGTAGTQPGGGGGGAFVNNNTNRNGGGGGNGQITITYTTAFKNYCSKTFSTVNQITNVTFSGINNTTSNTSTTANESFCFAANVTQAQTYSISLQGNTMGNFSLYFTVYADWDQNGVFGNNANEIFNIGTITNSTGIDGKLLNSTIDIPLIAAVGSTKMRIIANYGAYTTDPCTNNNFGQAEDYVVTVAAAPPCTSPTASATSLLFGTVTSTSISGSFTASSPASDGYMVVRSTSSTLGATPVDGTTYVVGNSFGSGTIVSVGNSTSFTDTGLIAGTLYYYFIFSMNYRCQSGPKYYTTALSGGQTSLCPVITGLASSNISYSSATISWTGTTNAASGYDYYVSTSNTPPTVSTIPTGTVLSGITSVDLTGLSLGTTYYFWVRGKCTSYTTSNWSSMASFTTTTCSTPSSTSNQYYINSVKFVGTLSDDSLTDYSVFDAGFATGGYADYSGSTYMANRAKQIPGGGINIYVGLYGTVSPFKSRVKAWVDWNKDGFFDENMERVYYSTDTSTAPATPYNISSTTFGFIVPLGTAIGTYKVRIRNYYKSSGEFYYDGCNSLGNGETEDFSFDVISDCAVSISSVTNGLGCGTGSVAISATGSAGTTSYQWYTKEYGAFAIPGATSSIYNTPNISSTTTYYVTALNGTCESVKRMPVVAKVNPVPTLSVSSSKPNICGDNDSLILSASGSTEERTLLAEDFEAGLLNFTLSNIGTSNGATLDAKTNWQVISSVYTPNNAIWHPAISSGLGNNKFVFATSDIGSGHSDINTVITNNNNIVFTGYKTLKLDFSLYFSCYNNGQNDGIYLEYSIDGGTTWLNLFNYSYLTYGNSKEYSVGYGTEFYNVPTIDVLTKIMTDNPALADFTKLKIRFRYNAKFADGVAIDNIRLYGDFPLLTSFNWSVPNSNLYNSDCTTPYSSAATSVCIKPTVSQIQNNNQWNVNASVVVSNGCSAYGITTVTNNSKFWDTNTSTNWNTLNWLPDSNVPNSNSCIIIKQPVYILSGTNGLGKNMKIYNTGKLTINSGGSLTITDFINNNAPSATDFTIESDASLIQLNDGAAITGNATVRRNLNLSSGRQEYSYISSPVSGFNLRGVYPGVSYSPSDLTYPRVVYYNESNDFFYNSSGAYIAGRGLGLKEPKTTDIPGSTVPLTFTGVPYNTPATFLNYGLAWTNSLHGYNLVGNPFPSNIDLNVLYAASSNIESTFRFWDNSVNNIYVQQGSLYKGYCYAIFNAATGSSGTGLPAPGFGAIASGGNGMPEGTRTPNNIVKVGQGFITRAKGAGAQVVFKNSERLYSNIGAEFYQKTGTQKDAADDSYVLYLNTPNNLNFPSAVVYFDNGSNAFDNDDSLLDAIPSDALYTFAGISKVLINGRSSFVNTDILDLGASYSTTGNFTISLINKKGVFDNGQSVYLYDKVLNTIVDLQKEPYSFNVSKTGTETGRFQIVYLQPSTVLNTHEAQKGDILVYRSGEDFVIRSDNEKITAIEIYDGSGKMVGAMKTNKNEVAINGEKIIDGIYILKIIRNCKISLRKVIK